MLKAVERVWLGAQVGAMRWLEHGDGHLALGERGEREAVFYLRRQGYVVVARRWKTPRIWGDVDLIAWDGATLCFVEVKTRGSREVASAESAVDEDKRRMLQRMARAYLRRFPEELRESVAVRFDVVSVYLLRSGIESGAASRIEFELHRAAFGWS